MPRLSLFLATLIAAIILIPLELEAQSLADVARAEEARRKATKAPPAKVYTNGDLKPGVEPPAPPVTPAPTAAKPAAQAPSGDVKAGDAKAADAKKGEAAAATKDEKYWRDRLSAARTTLQRSKAFLDAMQSQINGLYTEFVNVSDPAKRAVVEKKRLAAIAEQDRLKADIEAQTKAITAIEDEARREGVPSGWLR
ncbi:MAG TPA: hypothetical protein VJM31_13795 [Vicinamibacterales bacterium]|nr:hypothetical protein [Vicinamibacterales bacterium]